MVWVLPCNFDARCHHGGTRIYSQKIINIFGRGSSCGGGYSSCGSVGFGGGFWGMLGAGLGFGIGTRLFGGLSSWLNGGSFWGGMGFGPSASQGGGYYPGAGQAGAYGVGSGCGCNCGGAGSTGFGSAIGYVPGQYSITKTTDDKANDTGDDDDKVDGRAGDGAGDDDGNVGEGEGTVDGDKTPAGTTGDGDDKRYNLNDITEDIPADKLKTARANFWKSIGAKGSLKGLESAALPKGFDLKADKEGNIYLIHDGTAYKYDETSGKFKLPDTKQTDFRAYALKNKPTDDPSKVVNIGQSVNEKMTITSKTENDVTIVETTQEAGVKQNQEAVREAYTLAHGLTNHNSTTKVTVNDELAERTAKQYDLNGDNEITFDEFMALMNGYNVDAEKAASDSDYRKGRNLEKLNTVDIDSFDTIQFVEIFNKYANEAKTHITIESFAQLVKDIKGKSATELYNIA